MEYDEAERQCIADVISHGCHVLKVFDKDGEDPNFAYSVGFPVSVGQPEVLVYGLPLDLMHSMINEVLGQCREGLHLREGLRIGNLIEGHDCVAKYCTSRDAIAKHLTWAIWYHRSQSGTEVTRFFQLVWPGAVDGLFPWQDGASSDVIEAQPALYEVAA